jgi:hypothetical protein
MLKFLIFLKLKKFVNENIEFQQISIPKTACHNSWPFLRALDYSYFGPWKLGEQLATLVLW